MTKDQLQQLKTNCNWLEHFTDDALRVADTEQEVFDRMPAGAGKLALRRRIVRLTQAAALMREARTHLAEVAFDDSQQITG